MPIEHKDLTGALVHEPKGIEGASNDQVYAANGSGSGVWKSRLEGINNLNRFSISGTIPDVSTPNSSFFGVIPGNSTLNKMYAVLGGSIIAANDTITVYKNGVAQSTTLPIPFAGSGAGVKHSVTFSPGISFSEGDTVEVRSNGASDSATTLAVTLRFDATP